MENRKQKSTRTCVECAKDRGQLTHLKSKHRKLERRRRADPKIVAGIIGCSVPTRSMPKYCEICGLPPSGRLRNLCLDHDHTTHKFRGWLCPKCNSAVAAFGDNLKGIYRVIRYLKR